MGHNCSICHQRAKKGGFVAATVGGPNYRCIVPEAGNNPTDPIGTQLCAPRSSRWNFAKQSLPKVGVLIQNRDDVVI